MTSLTKPVTRRSSLCVRECGKWREMVVTLFPNDTIGLRPAGTHRQEIVTLASVYSLAVKQRVAAERADKKARRK